MPTKPSDVLPHWAKNGVYTVGPFIGFATKVAIPAGISDEGHVPGVTNPTSAEIQNQWQQVVYQWVDWVRLGTFDPDADAHLCETDSTGQLGLHGLLVDHLTDSTAATLRGFTTFAPVVSVEQNVGATGPLLQATGLATTGGPCITADQPGSGLGLFVSHSGASGNAASIQKTGAGGDALDVANLGSGGRAARFRSTGLHDAVEADGSAGSDAPLRLVPDNDPSTNRPGQVWVETFLGLSYRFPISGAIRRVWATAHGLEYDNDYTSTLVATASTSELTIATVSNFQFRQNAKYMLFARFQHASRTAFKTASFRLRVNGNVIPETAAPPVIEGPLESVAGRATKEFSGMYPYTHSAADVLANVTMTLQPIGGAGLYVYQQRSLAVLGHLD